MDIIYDIKAAIMCSILHLLWHFSIGFSQFETPDRQTPRGTGLYPRSIMHPCVRIMHHGNSYLAVELFVALRPWPDTQPECSLYGSVMSTVSIFVGTTAQFTTCKITGPLCQTHPWEPTSHQKLSGRPNIYAHPLLIHSNEMLRDSFSR